MLERLLKLDTNRIGWILDAILAFGIAQPFRPYDHQHDIRIAQGTGNVISKIDADRNAVDIHKD